MKTQENFSRKSTHCAAGTNAT